MSVTFATRERAEGGVGLIGLQANLGYAVVPARDVPGPDWDYASPSPSDSGGVAYYDELLIPRLRRRAEVIHAASARCLTQIAHTGAASHHRA